MSLKQCICLLLLLSRAVMVQAAGATAVFTPPQAYPVERYEAGWNKNPFTLKTVVPTTPQGSFAQDLAIGAHYGAADNPTVVIVNTKTNERIPLRKDKPGPGGMTLKSMKVSISRKDCQAEVALGSEVAQITYDTKYLGQLASNEVNRMAATKQNPAMPQGGKPVQMPPVPVPVPGGRPPGMPPQPNRGGPMNQTGQVNPVNQGTQPPMPVAPAAAAMASTTGTPSRTRVIVPVVPSPQARQ